MKAQFSTDPKAKTILLVDDEESFLNGMKSLLELQGYTVFTAMNGIEGINILEQTPVDIVITDILMPEMDGIELILRLKNKYPEIKIISISGGGRIRSDDYLNLSLSFGVNAALKKPFSSKDLLSELKYLSG
jgi:YesN/AraC family two-component response regulator